MIKGLYFTRDFYLNGNGGLLLEIWRRIPVGTVVSIPWPGLEDPNDVWLPWLSANVGRQQIMWEWWLHNDVDTVKIRFLNKNAAAEFILRFG